MPNKYRKLGYSVQESFLDPSFDVFEKFVSGRRFSIAQPKDPNIPVTLCVGGMPPSAMYSRGVAKIYDVTLSEDVLEIFKLDAELIFGEDLENVLGPEFVYWYQEHPLEVDTNSPDHKYPILNSRFLLFKSEFIREGYTFSEESWTFSKEFENSILEFRLLDAGRGIDLYKYTLEKGGRIEVVLLSKEDGLVIHSVFIGGNTDLYTIPPHADVQPHIADLYSAHLIWGYKPTILDPLSAKMRAKALEKSLI